MSTHAPAEGLGVAYVRRRTAAAALAVIVLAVPPRAARGDAAGEGAGDAAVVTRPRPARDRSADRPGLRPRPVAAASRLEGTIDVDGRPAEAAWARAKPQTGFWQRNPDEGAPSRFPTRFRVLYDDEAIYVGVRCLDPHPDRIRALLTRRDADSPSDWIELAIDSYADRRTAFLFALNPAGVKRDVLIHDDVRTKTSWDAVWEGDATLTGGGWAAEFRIPYTQLRFSGAGDRPWGLQVSRLVQRAREESVWAPRPVDSNRRVSLFGALEGVSPADPPTRIELLPYAVIGARVTDAKDDNPFASDLGVTGGAGIDLEYGLGQSFTLSATVNPDFGQVEADPSEVNLSAQEPFFAEKRPFFLEGSEIFSFSLGQKDSSQESLFYSRRIGAAPHGDVGDEGAHATAPDATTIYGAAKLSGKTSSGWSVGVLDAVTAAEHGRVAFADGTRDQRLVEPLANYGVLRVQKDLNGGRTTAGGAVTTVHRDVDGTPLDTLHDQAYTAGLEIDHRFADGAWEAQARAVGSYVRGAPAAIARTQRAIRHLFQRPDATHVDYDPDRTSLAGVGHQWMIGRMGSDTWRFAAGADSRSPGLELGDLGFQRGGDTHVQWFWLQNRNDDPGNLIRQRTVNLNLFGAWDYAPELLGQGGNVNGQVTFTNYYSAWAGLGVNRAFLEPGALRGGPAIRGDTSYSGWLGASTDPRRDLRAQLDSTFWVEPASNSWEANVGLSASLQARSNLELSLGPTWSRRIVTDQYVTEVEDAAGDAHPILAEIDHGTVALTVRANYTVSPALSFQLYAQPFVSAGGYSRYKEVVAPRARAPGDRYHVLSPDEYTDEGGVRSVDADGDGANDYSFELADFSFRQLRANLVARWQYLPGSTLFVIWSHGRTTSATDGRLGGADLSALAGEVGEHVVLVKLGYWFGD